jgi:hypothetical protein
MHQAMTEEKVALLHAIDKIWDDINAFKEREFASNEITSSWKNKLQS